MEEYYLETLTKNLKIISKADNITERDKAGKIIKNILGLFLFKEFYMDINDKITRDKVIKYITDIFNKIKLKEKKKVIVACNELNNTLDIINNRDLVVDIAIDFDNFIYGLNIGLKEFDMLNHKIESKYLNHQEQILNM